MLDRFGKVEKLVQAPILRNVSLEHLYDLAARAEHRDDYRIGDELFSPDKPIDFLFVLISGQVDVVRKESGTIEIIQTSTAPDTLGEMGLFQTEPIGIGGVAASPHVACLLIPRSDMEELLELQPSLAQDIIGSLARRLAGAYDDLLRRTNLGNTLGERLEAILSEKLTQFDQISDISSKLDRLLESALKKEKLRQEVKERINESVASFHAWLLRARPKMKENDVSMWVDELAYQLRSGKMEDLYLDLPRLRVLGNALPGFMEALGEHVQERKMIEKGRKQSVDDK